METTRKGGKFEGIGFLLIIAGLIVLFTVALKSMFFMGLALMLLVIGFVVFLIGRFL